MKSGAPSPDPALRRYASGTIDWCDAATVGTSRRSGPLALARACFSGASLPMRAFLVVGWRCLLLEGRAVSDADHILGWPVVQVGPVTVLQRRSRLGIQATLAFAEDNGVSSFSSGMVYSGRLARLVWPAVAPLHRWVVRRTLAQAVGR